MKNIYLTFTLLTFLFTSNAQSSFNYPSELEDECSTIDKVNSNQSIDDKSGVTIWSEDFANGFPAGWSIQDLSGICPWVWSNDGSWGYFNSNSGASAGTAINSSTAANGFLICDPDSANHVNYGQPSGSNYQYLESYFTTSVIDLTGHPSVVLEFQQYFRFNNGIDMYVMVSNNNATWTTYTVQGNNVNNTYSDNADTVKINISAVAGNQPTVYIKIGWSARVYCWMIDDMKIMEAEANDLTLKSHYFETLGLPYYKIPTSQITDIYFSSSVINNGANDQTNSKLSIDVNSTVVGASNPVTINSGNSDSLYLSNAYAPPSTLGLYDLKWIASSDSIDDTPSDNYANEIIEVTDYTYARDNDSPDGNRYNSGEPYEIGNYYDIINNETLEGIEFKVDDASNPGSVVYAAVYSIDAASGDFIWEGNTDDYILTSSDVSNESLITLCLFNPINLTGGKGYLPVVGSYGDAGATNDLVVRTAGVSAPQTSFKYDGSDLTWYYTTKTPMVRMLLTGGCGWNINEQPNLFASLEQNQPNPFTESTLINIELKQSGSVLFEVTDISGKIVFSNDLGNLNLGPHQIEFEGAEFNAGIYFYSLSIGSEKITKKMIINH
jgi:hypothetical protein